MLDKKNVNQVTVRLIFEKVKIYDQMFHDHSTQTAFW
jgi:hypothetical protein